MKVFATYNIKGGVGKTTAAVNLAYLAARSGDRTLLWDLDPQGSATYLFRVKPRVKGGGRGLVRGRRPLGDAIKGTDYANLELLPADFRYRRMDLDLDDAKRPVRRIRRVLRTVVDEYDVVFLDCPPSVSLVSENILEAADVLVVPLIPTTLSLRTYDQLIEFVRDFDGRRPRVRTFFSMVDRRKRLHTSIIEQLPTERPGVGRTVVPALSIVEQMAVRREPLVAFAPRSAAARCYEQVWDDIRTA